MFPHERSLVKQLSDKPFALIGVNSDSDLEFARSEGEEQNISWRSFWNGKKGTQGPISVQWNIKSWPTIYVIDAKGVIRYKNIRGKELDEAITKLLAEAGHEVEIEHDEDNDKNDDAKKDDAKKDRKSVEEKDKQADK